MNMKVLATGLLNRCADLLPKRATYENQADMHRFLLREMAMHIEQVRKGEVSLQEFAEHYCIIETPPTDVDSWPQWMKDSMCAKRQEPQEPTYPNHYDKDGYCDNPARGY